MSSAMTRCPCAGAVIGALMALAMAVSPARADPVVTESVDYYDVSGADAQAIRQDINRNGPVSVVDGKRYSATAHWHVAWTYKYRQNGTGCVIASAATTVKATIVFPRLKSDLSTPSELKRAFDTYAEALMLHEKGHVQNGIDIAKRIENGIRALPGEETCPALGVAANALGARLIKEAHQLDIDYDQRTQHGRTQGAKFP
jgi:predicted secreted Zn-dependent protease